MANFNPNSLKTYNGRFDAGKFNRLVDILFKQKLCPGPTYGLQQGAGGIIIVPAPAGITAAPSAYTVQDASIGSTPNVSVTPGTHNGTTPTINGHPINVKIGTPLAYPVLTVNGTDTVLYFKIDYNTSGGITSVEIMSGTTLPSATISTGVSGSDYKMLSSISVSFDSETGNAVVTCLNDVLSGPQGYSICGSTSTVWLV